MELEALEAIYADAFSMTSEKPLEWRIHLEPTEGGAGEVNHGTRQRQREKHMILPSIQK